MFAAAVLLIDLRDPPPTCFFFFPPLIAAQSQPRPISLSALWDIRLFPKRLGLIEPFPHPPYKRALRSFPAQQNAWPQSPLFIHAAAPSFPLHKPSDDPALSEAIYPPKTTMKCELIVPSSPQTRQFLSPLDFPPDFVPSRTLEVISHTQSPPLTVFLFRFSRLFYFFPQMSF